MPFQLDRRRGIQPLEQAGALWEKAFIHDGKGRTKALYNFARKAMQPVAIWVLPKPLIELSAIRPASKASRHSML